jgi:hypothetical protein
MWQLNWSDSIFCVRYQQIFYFVLSSRRNQKSREGEIKFGAHRTSHLTSISHLTSKPSHDASRHPFRWRRWEDARVLSRAGRVASLLPRSIWWRRVRRCVPPRQNCVLPLPRWKINPNPLRKTKPPRHPPPPPPRTLVDCSVVEVGDRAVWSNSSARSQMATYILPPPT